jgi:hypothetical protein
MHLGEAVAADLALLSDALDEGNLVDTLDQLSRNARTAVPSYLGLSVILGHSDEAVIFTVRDGDLLAEVCTSVYLPLSRAPEASGPAIAIVLYAATPGSLVDLAADLSWLTGRSLADFLVDEHLHVAAQPDSGRLLADESEIHQALGVLICAGLPPEQARSRLAILAAANSGGLIGAARAVLADLSASPDADSAESGS